MNQYCFKRSFSFDRTLSDRLFNLLESVFPEIGISDAAERARVLGAPWEAASTPFVLFHDRLAVTHVGVVEIPMQVMGQAVTVGGIHAVCTRSEFRRRGYYRQVMEEVLDYCDRRYKTLILTTAQPELYSIFGFRVVEEHAFFVKCNWGDRASSFRMLEPEDPKDRELLQRLLKEREPVSNVVGVVNEKAVFCVNEGTRPLHYAEDIDAIVCLEIEDTRLKLFDIVATRLCTLAAIIERIDRPIDEVTIYFSPDRLDVDARAFSHILDGDSLLMVRGSFAAEGTPFMLPRSARC